MESNLYKVCLAVCHYLLTKMWGSVSMCKVVGNTPASWTKTYLGMY